MRQKILLITLLTSTLLVSLLGTVQLRKAHAANIITVTTKVDDFINNGNCTLREAIQAANSQAAVDACAAGTGDDEIDLAAGTYDLLTKDAAMNPLSHPIFIGSIVGCTTCSLVINPNKNDVIIDASDTANGGAGLGDSMFNIAHGIVTFNHITFQNGTTSGAGGALEINDSDPPPGGNGTLVTINDSVFLKNSAEGTDGGAIDITNGTVAINNVIFQHNQATQNGGAIATSGTTVTTISKSHFGIQTAGEGNTATISGGAIYNYGTLTITDTDFLGNTANGTAVGDGGGAIFNGSMTTLTVTGSTFGIPIVPTGTTYENSAPNTNARGGAIYNNVSTGGTTIQESAIVGNFSRDDGGGIFTQGPLNLTRSFLSQNQSTTFPNKIGSFASYSDHTDVTISNTTITEGDTGGSLNAAVGVKSQTGFGVLALVNDTIAQNLAIGIRQIQGDLQVQNTIVAENPVDCSGTIISNGNNIEGATSCNFVQTGDQHNITVGQLNLLPLQANGGAVFQLNYMPQFPSAAIDQANEGACDAAPVSDYDQRSLLSAGTTIRPLDGNGDNSKICDVGSIEAPTVLPTSTPTDTPTATNTATSTPTNTSVNTNTNTPSKTATNTPTKTATSTSTSTSTPTNTGSKTATPTSTSTSTPTSTGSKTATATSTSTSTPTSTGTKTATATSSPTFTPTSTGSVTSTFTPTKTSTATPTNTATPTSTPVVGRIDSIGIFRTNTFYLRLHNSTGNADITAAFSPASKPYPVVGDWTGAGYDTIGIYDQSNGLFTLCTANSTSSCTNVANQIQFVLGVPNDVPLAGRWTAGATGMSDGVFRPSNGLIYLRNSLTSGYGDEVITLGIPGDVGLVGDWNGDGIDSPGVYRSATQRFLLTDTVCNCTPTVNYNFQYGLSGDAPVVGDWTGQGHDGVGLFRQSNGFTYLKNGLTTGFADIAFTYGIAGDIPIAGHYQLVYPPAPNPGAVLVPPTAQSGKPTDGLSD